MESHACEWNVKRMATILGVSRSGYYRYLHAKPSNRAQANQALLEKIKTIHQDNRELYGSPRIHAALKQQGVICGRHRVARLMKKNNIQAKIPKSYKITTKVNPALSVAKNLLNQDFSAQRPNEKWVSDLTYIKTREGWLYLAVILDLFSRRIVGMSMSASMTAEVVVKAFNQAARHRNYPKEFIYHSDRGSQYASKAFQGLLKAHQILISMSGGGNCYDNAAMESFFHTLKTECVYQKAVYTTRKEAEQDIFDYVETFYNPKRLHSTLNYVSPKAFEADYYRQKKESSD
jgi:putative transposase